MCGIAGFYASKGIDKDLLHLVTGKLAHRGPDAAGYYVAPSAQVGLGHRRLSIIDTSTSANQPMHSADGRYVIVFNGEIYNFRQLKSRLPGFGWKTSGDTEVIVELFAHFGSQVFGWLNGIFALAIYDSREDQLWLARDALGVKPLFISRTEGRFSFASELKALALVGRPAAAAHAVPLFLHLGYIPEPYTIYEGVEKFPAGCFGLFAPRQQEWVLTRYWNAEDHYRSAAKGEKEEQVLERGKELLFAAVERQMISDVPLGTFLSGGIDSSLVTAVAAQVRGGGQKLKTFSIGFDEPRFDESEFAGKVATHLHTDHHLFRVSEQDVLELLPRFISVYDEPFADSSAFPTMLVSRLARQHVTVVLSGDGGDELFQGYGMYAWARRLSNPGVRLLRKPAYWLSRIMGERYRRAGNLFCYPNQAHIPSHIFSQEQNLFHEKELKSMLVNPDFDFNPLNNIVDTGLPQERQALWDVQHYLKDDLLVKVDRASMHFGLEVRVPLQDQEFVAFALGLPYRYKVNEGQTKYLLRQILYSFVPQEIFERPKRGFAIPLHKWLKGELKSQVDKYLSGDLVEAAGWVRPAYVRALLARYYKGESYLYNRIWVLLVLHWWYHTECNKEW